MRPDGSEDDGVSVYGVRVLRATDKALLCSFPVDDDECESRELWVPRSQITQDSEVFEMGDQGELVVTSWFAEREGLG